MEAVEAGAMEAVAMEAVEEEPAVCVPAGDGTSGTYTLMKPCCSPSVVYLASMPAAVCICRNHNHQGSVRVGGSMGGGNVL